MDYYDLNLGLTKEDLALKTETNKFAREIMRPISIELDQMTAEEAIAPQSPFWVFLKKAYEAGYHTSVFPAEVGGAGLTPLQVAIVHEELAWGSFGLALSLMTSLDAAAAMGGGEEQIKQFTIPFCECTDGSYIGCWAITEPDHGSDTLMVGYPSFRDPAIAAQCVARVDGDEYVISGQKSSWVSNGTIAKTILLMCQVDTDMGHAGGGMFLFSLDQPGVSRGKPFEKMGTRELNQGEVFFDEVRVPKSALIVTPEHYESELEAHLCLTLPVVGIWAVGLARAAFEEAIAYARTRVQGGKPIAEHKNIQTKLFDMFRKIEAARQLCRAAILHNYSFPMDPEKRIIEYSMAAKTLATQTALEVTNDAVQIFGSYGIGKEFIIEKFYRDARPTLICDGSNDTLTISGGRKISEFYPRSQKKSA